MTTNMPSQTSQKRLEIEFEPADLADVTDKAVTVLKARDQVFSQGGRVVQVATVPVDVGGGSATRTFLSPSTVSTLRDSASRHMIFRNPPTIIKGKDGRQKVVQGAALLPPKAVMEALIGRQGAGLNPVMMASGSPVFRKDGTVAQANGYDASSGIYVQLDATYPAVPENPTKADALVALDQLSRRPATSRVLKAGPASGHLRIPHIKYAWQICRCNLRVSGPKLRGKEISIGRKSTESKFRLRLARWSDAIRGLRKDRALFASTSCDFDRLIQVKNERPNRIIKSHEERLTVEHRVAWFRVGHGTRQECNFR